MADKRIKNWDAQSERLAGLKIAIDHEDFNEAKTILASILCPATNELTESTGTLNKTGTYVRINVGAVELKALLSDVVPDIINYTAATIFNATYTNYIHFYVGGPVAANFVISADNFATALFARTAFKARALAVGVIDGLTPLGYENLAYEDLFRLYNASDGTDRRVRWEDLVGDLVDTSLFINAAKAVNTEEVMLAKLQETVVDQALSTGENTYGYISMCKIGKMVTGTVVISQSTGGTEKIAEYSIPSDWRPNRCGRSACNLIIRNDVATADNILYIQTTASAGTIILNINILSDPYTHNGFSFGWMTE